MKRESAQSGFMRPWFKAFALFSFCLLLAACADGGGESSAGGTPPPQVTGDTQPPIILPAQPPVVAPPVSPPVIPPVKDTTPPSMPAALAKVSATPASITIEWRASTDNVAVTSYEVYRDGAMVGEVPASAEQQMLPEMMRPLQFTEGGLSPETAYTYAVSAKDAAGNISPPSAPPLVATTASDKWMLPKNHIGNFVSVNDVTGDVYIIGYDASAGALNERLFLAKINVDGILAQNIAYFGSQGDNPVDIVMHNSDIYLRWSVYGDGDRFSRYDANLHHIKTLSTNGLDVGGINNMVVSDEGIYLPWSAVGDPIVRVGFVKISLDMIYKGIISTQVVGSYPAPVSIFTHDNKLYLAGMGYAGSPSAGFSNSPALVASITPSAEFIWGKFYKSYPNLDHGYDFMAVVFADSAGVYAGGTLGSGAEDSCAILKYAHDSTFLWDKELLPHKGMVRFLTSHPEQKMLYASGWHCPITAIHTDSKNVVWQASTGGDIVRHGETIVVADGVSNKIIRLDALTGAVLP